MDKAILKINKKEEMQNQEVYSENDKSEKYKFMKMKEKMMQDLQENLEKDIYNVDKEHFKDLIDNILFEDLFEDFQIKYTQITDAVERKKYILKFLSFIFDDEENFSNIVDKKIIHLLGKSFLKALNKQEELIKLKEVIFSVLPQPQMSAIVASLILNEYYEEALQGLEILTDESKDLSIYPETINEIVRKNSKVGLKFLCENFKNIHFNNDSLLRIAHTMNLESLQILIDDFSFNMNTFNNLNIKNIKKNTILELLTNNNTSFKSFYDIYHNQIDWNLNKDGNPLWMDLVNKIYNSKNYELCEFLLNDNNINKKIYNYIGKIILDDSAFFFNESNDKKEDIYKAFFKNSLFDHAEYNFKQGYFLYGILSKIGIHSMKNEANSSYNQNTAQNYFNILKIYLEEAKDDLIPNTPEFNIIGAAIHVYNTTESPIGLETAKLIIQNYKEYINTPNPSGKLSIELVSQDSPIYNMLIVNGAIPADPSPTFWKSMFKIFNKKEKNQIFQPNIDVKKDSKENVRRNAESIADIRINMKNDFRSMKDLLSNELCDLKIKLKCENMFLKADKLAMIMEKNNLITFYDELFFLNENFSNYLRKSIDSYINTMTTIKEISNEQLRNNKSEEAKSLCLEHIDLLKEQLEQMIDNISSNIADNSISDLKVRGKFLKERFKQNGTVDNQDKQERVIEIDLNNGNTNQKEKNRQENEIELNSPNNPSKRMGI